MYEWFAVHRYCTKALSAGARSVTSSSPVPQAPSARCIPRHPAAPIAATVRHSTSCGALPEPRTRPAPAWLRPTPHACWGRVKAAQRGRLRLRRRPAATCGVTTTLPLSDPLAFRHANMLIRTDSRVVFNDTLEDLLDVLRVFVSPPDWEIVRWFRFPVPS